MTDDMLFRALVRSLVAGVPAVGVTLPSSSKLFVPDVK